MKYECSQRTFSAELTHYVCRIQSPRKWLRRFPGLWMFRSDWHCVDIWL